MTLSLSAFPYTIGVTTAKEAWDKLSRHFSQVSTAHVLSLRKQLHNIKKGSQSMGAYLQQFKHVTDQLAASRSPVTDDDLLVCVLNCLSNEYKPFASSIQARSSCITINELYSLLVAEELCLLNEVSADNVVALTAQHPQSYNKRPFK